MPATGDPRAAPGDGPATLTQCPPDREAGGLTEIGIHG
jgi:hypothetical protein